MGFSQKLSQFPSTRNENGIPFYQERTVCVRRDLEITVKVVSARLCRLPTFISNFRGLKTNFRAFFDNKNPPGISLWAAWGFSLFRIAHKSNLGWAKLDRRCSGFTSGLRHFGSDLHKHALITLNETIRGLAYAEKEVEGLDRRILADVINGRSFTTH